MALVVLRIGNESVVSMKVTMVVLAASESKT